MTKILILQGEISENPCPKNKYECADAVSLCESDCRSRVEYLAKQSLLNQMVEVDLDSRALDYVIKWATMRPKIGYAQYFIKYPFSQFLLDSIKEEKK